MNIKKKNKFLAFCEFDKKTPGTMAVPVAVSRRIYLFFQEGYWC